MGFSKAHNSIERRVGCPIHAVSSHVWASALSVVERDDLDPPIKAVISTEGGALAAAVERPPHFAFAVRPSPLASELPPATKPHHQIQSTAPSHASLPHQSRNIRQHKTTH